MHPFPHHYQVKATDQGVESVTISAQSLPDILSAPPVEFEGPGNQWSPETLLIAAVAGCFVLSFKAVADASKFEWTSLECQTHGTLDQVDRVTRFTAFKNTVNLKIPAGSSDSQARRLLDKAEQICLISNSLTADVQLDVQIEITA